MLPKPNHPCSRCKTDDWWLRDTTFGPGEWLCGTCHPNPNALKTDSRKCQTTHLTPPVANYQQIKCILGPLDNPKDCAKLCGLTCAENCLRFSDKVCPGCPCLKGGDHAKT